MLLICFSWPVFAELGEAQCGKLDNGNIGPWDYTDPAHRKKSLNLVESAHFTRSVEMLVSGNTSYLWEDLDYTLRAFPNHHRALHSMANYQIRTPRPIRARYRSADCYFDRAMRFRPNDPVVRMVYGIYLYNKGDYKEAEVRYKEALAMVPDYTEAHYNLGLLYVETGQIELAKAHAEKAYARDYPLPGLREKLARLAKKK